MSFGESDKWWIWAHFLSPHLPPFRYSALIKTGRLKGEYYSKNELLMAVVRAAETMPGIGGVSIEKLGCVSLHFRLRS